MKPLNKYTKILISLLIVVPLGFLSKFYAGPAQNWVNNSLGGVFYEIFFCLLLCLILRKMKAHIIATVVFFCTCALEFLQLWHPPLLQFIRSFFLGAAFLGTSFSWKDFPYYLIGSLIGWFWVKTLSEQEDNYLKR